MSSGLDVAQRNPRLATVGERPCDGPRTRGIVTLVGLYRMSGCAGSASGSIVGGSGWSRACWGAWPVRLAGTAAVQQESTATGRDAGGPEWTREDGDLRRYTLVDGLPLDGMHEVWGSNPHSSTRSTRSECGF